MTVYVDKGKYKDVEEIKQKYLNRHKNNPVLRGMAKPLFKEVKEEVVVEIPTESDVNPETEN